MGSSSSTCKPCDIPCPAGFTYTESCGYWWWETDAFECAPAELPADAAQQSIVDMQYTGCPCSTLGNCYSTKSAAPCPPGSTETDLQTDCCGAPFSNDGCSPGYGFHETRTCVKDETYVFALTDGSRTCPNMFFKEMAEFPVCSFCDQVEKKVGEQGSFLSCWLPYAANSDGDCFAFDKDKVGWFDASSNGEWRQGGDESLLPMFGEVVDRSVKHVGAEFGGVASSNVHVGADATVGLGGAAACVVGVGLFVRGRKMRKKKELGGEGMAMV